MRTWRRTHRSVGYCATLLGSLLGAIVLAVAGGYLSVWWMNRYTEDLGLEAIGYGFLAMGVGACTGGAVGGFIALRLRRHRRAGTTLAVLAVLVPGVAVASFELVPERLSPSVEAIILLVTPLVARRVSLIGAGGAAEAIASGADDRGGFDDCSSGTRHRGG